MNTKESVTFALYKLSDLIIEICNKLTAHKISPNNDDSGLLGGHLVPSHLNINLYSMFLTAF
jgi:hypothetical protein